MMDYITFARAKGVKKQWLNRNYLLSASNWTYELVQMTPTHGKRPYFHLVVHRIIIIITICKSCVVLLCYVKWQLEMKFYRLYFLHTLSNAMFTHHDKCQLSNIIYQSLVSNPFLFFSSDTICAVHWTRMPQWCFNRCCVFFCHAWRMTNNCWSSTGCVIKFDIFFKNSFVYYFSLILLHFGKHMLDVDDINSAGGWISVRNEIYCSDQNKWILV